MSTQCPKDRHGPTAPDRLGVGIVLAKEHPLVAGNGQREFAVRQSHGRDPGIVEADEVVPEPLGICTDSRQESSSLELFRDEWGCDFKNPFGKAGPNRPRPAPLLAA